jgi:hypothetical protein
MGSIVDEDTIKSRTRNPWFNKEKPPEVWAFGLVSKRVLFETAKILILSFWKGSETAYRRIKSWPRLELLGWITMNSDSYAPR